MFVDKDRQIQDWGFQGNKNFGEKVGATVQKGSQYLLGVGKADITGYFPMFVLVDV